MNNSWMFNSGSPGFMYYSLDTTPSKNKAEVQTSDLHPFSEPHNPSPQASRFNPTHYSSPQNFRRGGQRNFRKRGWKQDYSNKSYSPNTSFNSGSNSSWNRSRDSSFHSYKSCNDSSNISSYFHPSFLEDPWANLEKQLEWKRQSEMNKPEQSSDSSDSDKNEQVT